MDGRACSSGSPSPTAGRSPTAGPSPGGGPSPSHGGGYSTFSGREELPDLTEHLKANGIYEEYVAYRKGYLEWRRGRPEGARGELTAEALEQQGLTENGFEYWYPTASIFQLRFTIAYWISVLFLLGSIFFCVNASNRMLHAYGGRVVMVWPNLFGSCCYIAGCYLMYLQLINLPTRRVDALRILCPDWSRIGERATSTASVGTCSFLVGACLFQISCVADLWEAPKFASLIISVPNFIGSILFVVGGVCEVLINRTRSGTYDDTAWFASWFTLLGSVAFTVAAVPPMVAPSELAFLTDMGYFLGGFFFAINAVLLLLLWEADDFGLTMLKQLNRVTEVSRHGTAKLAPSSSVPDSKMSIRDVTFITVYCWFISMACLDCIIKEEWYKEGFYRQGLLLFTGLGMQIFIVIVVFIVLLIHSVVLQVPKAEPFRSATHITRAMMIFGAFCQSVDVIAFFSGYATMDSEFLKSILRRHGLMVPSEQSNDPLSGLFRSFHF